MQRSTCGAMLAAHSIAISAHSLRRGGSTRGMYTGVVRAIIRIGLLCREPCWCVSRLRTDLLRGGRARAKGTRVKKTSFATSPTRIARNMISVCRPCLLRRAQRRCYGKQTARTKDKQQRRTQDQAGHLRLGTAAVASVKSLLHCLCSPCHTATRKAREKTRQMHREPTPSRARQSAPQTHLTPFAPVGGHLRCHDPAPLLVVSRTIGR